MKKSARIGGSEVMLEDLKGLSMTGRLCYLFMCLEKYLLANYPNLDWTPVAKRCWQWTNGYWDEGFDIYAPVVPEFLLEFDNYEETNRLAFDGKLSEADYMALSELFGNVMMGNQVAEINQILLLLIVFNNVCEGTNFAAADQPTLAVLKEALQLLQAHGIALPSIDKVKNMTVDIKNGWGDFLDSEYLSIILNA